jgi:hypothetical protein
MIIVLSVGDSLLAELDHSVPCTAPDLRLGDQWAPPKRGSCSATRRAELRIPKHCTHHADKRSKVAVLEFGARLKIF